MSKIKIFGLGGLAENGKNTFVVEVNDEIYVLDMGIKYPDEELIGIDLVYSDISYLIENKNRIQGIFLSSGHEDHLGAVPYLLKHFTDIPVFATHFTISVLEEILQEEDLDFKKYKLYRINDEKVLKFKSASVQFYNVAHSIPETCHIAIMTEDGTIVYAPDYSFDSSKDRRYKISYSKIMEVAKTKVLAVLTESLGVNNDKRAASDYELDYQLSEAFLEKKRVIFTCFSSDIKRIQKIINEAISYDRKVAILGRRAQKLIAIAIDLGYLEIPKGKVINLKQYDEHHKNDDPNLVIIVAGSRHEPYYMMQRMAKGQDLFVKLKEDDLCMFITPPVQGTETMAQQTISMLSKKGISVINMTKQSLKGHHASENDLKMLWSMLKPHYIIPIIGEYRHQFAQKEIALKAGYSSEQIILLENGDVLEFTNGEILKKIQKIKVSEVMIDGATENSAADDDLMKDRQKLANDGVVMGTVLVDKSSRSLQDLTIKTKGLPDEMGLERLLKNELTMAITAHLQKGFVDIVNLKRLVNTTVWQYIKNSLRKYPIILMDVLVY